MTMLHAESFEDCEDIGFQTETDSGTIFIAVDLDAEELTCRTEVRDLIFLREFCLDLDRSLGGGLRILHGEIVDIQKYQNTIAAEIEIWIG
jgi:hypothetical protein